MQLQILLKAVGASASIPVHYNYHLQSAIYSLLPSDLANKIHNDGYMVGNRKFKLYGLSSLMGDFYLDKMGDLLIFKGDIGLVIVSPDTTFINALSNSLLTIGSIRLGHTVLTVDSIRITRQAVSGNEMVARTLSPIVAYSTLLKPQGGKYTVYYQPGEKEFTKLISNNLRKKYEAFFENPAPEGDVGFWALDRPRFHILYYKDTIIKGYSCRLKMTGPRDLLQMALDGGIGSKNSSGFGVLQLTGQSTLRSQQL